MIISSNSLTNQLVQVETGRDGTNRGRITRYRYDLRGHRTQTIRVDQDDREHAWETTVYDWAGHPVSTANAFGQTTIRNYSRGQLTSINRPFSPTETSDIQYVYDNAGRLFQEIDPLGVITQTEYDDMGHLRKTTEALGTSVQRTRERGYDLNANLTSITYSDGTNTFTTHYDYDLLNRRIAIRGAREYPKQFEYDANDNLMAEINGRGYRTEHAYDQYNRRTNTVEGIDNGEPGEHVGSFEYDMLGRVVTSFDGNWNHTHYHYDPLGRKTEESVPLDFTNAFPTGDWWADSNVVLNRTSYNPWGQPMATANIGGGVFLSLYDTFGRRVSQTDAAGLTLTNEYNENDQLLRIQYPSVSSNLVTYPPTSIQYHYSPYSSEVLASVTDRAHLTTQFTYNRRMEKCNKTSSWGSRTTYGYDELGRLAAETNTLGEVTRVVSDQFDRIVTVIYADDQTVSPRREYRSYDAFGKITNHWGAATCDIAYSFDAAGNMIGITDANGNTTDYQYDGRNRKVKRIYADGSFETYHYDACNNLITHTDPRGQTTRFFPNARMLSHRIEYSRDQTVTFEYDPMGRCTKMVDNTGTNLWTYSPSGSITTNTQSCAGTSISYRYDAEGRRLEMSVHIDEDAEPWKMLYSYDEAGRLATITDSRVSVQAFQYRWRSDANRVSSIVYPNGIHQEISYDTLGRRTNQAMLGRTEEPICAITDAYEHNGLLHEETTLARRQTFTYDAKSRLKTVDTSSFGGQLMPLESYVYEYDYAGNRLQSLSGAFGRQFSVNQLNQITNMTGDTSVKLSYDDNGNLVDDGMVRYEYDNANRLAVSLTATNRECNYYDGLGRRVITEAATPIFTNSMKIVYDSALPILVLSDGDGKTTLTRGLDIFLSLGGHGGIGSIIAIKSREDIAFLFSDSRGSTRGIVDTQGKLTCSLDYGFFCEGMREFERSAKWLLSSKELMSQGSLLDYGGRYLSVSLGRWLTRDPNGDSAGPNLYTFVDNDPTDLVDRDGRWSVSIHCDILGGGECGVDVSIPINTFCDFTPGVSYTPCNPKTGCKKLKLTVGVECDALKVFKFFYTKKHGNFLHAEDVFDLPISAKLFAEGSAGAEKCGCGCIKLCKVSFKGGVQSGVSGGGGGGPNEASFGVTGQLGGEVDFCTGEAHAGGWATVKLGVGTKGDSKIGVDGSYEVSLTKDWKFHPLIDCK